MLNKVQLIGRTGKDPDVKHLDSGLTVASFTLATSEKFKDKSGEVKEKTEWHNCQAWGKLAEVCNQYVKKGMAVFVAGKLRGDKNGNPTIYTNATGQAASSFEMTAQEVKFLSRSEGGQEHEAQHVGGELPPEDDIPF